MLQWLCYWQAAAQALLQGLLSYTYSLQRPGTPCSLLDNKSWPVQITCSCKRVCDRARCLLQTCCSSVWHFHLTATFLVCSSSALTQLHEIWRLFALLSLCALPAGGWDSSTLGAQCFTSTFPSPTFGGACRVMCRLWIVGLWLTEAVSLFYLSSKLGDKFWRQRNEKDKHGDFLLGWWTFIRPSSLFILTTDMLKRLKTNGSKSQETCISACLCSLMEVVNLWCIISAPLPIPKLYFKESPCCATVHFKASIILQTDWFLACYSSASAKELFTPFLFFKAHSDKLSDIAIVTGGAEVLFSSFSCKE